MGAVQSGRSVVKQRLYTIFELTTRLYLNVFLFHVIELVVGVVLKGPSCEVTVIFADFFNYRNI